MKRKSLISLGQKGLAPTCFGTAELDTSVLERFGRPFSPLLARHRHRLALALPICRRRRRRSSVTLLHLYPNAEGRFGTIYSGREVAADAHESYVGVGDVAGGGGSAEGFGLGDEALE